MGIQSIDKEKIEGVEEEGDFNLIFKETPQKVN